MERKTDVIDIKVQSKDRLLPLLRGELRHAIAGALGAKVRLSERNRNVWAIQYPIALPVERVVTARRSQAVVMQVYCQHTGEYGKKKKLPNLEGS